MLLRAETIYYLNNQDYSHFVPVAKDYLGKYGDNEGQMLEGNIKQHGGPSTLQVESRRFKPVNSHKIKHQVGTFFVFDQHCDQHRYFLPGFAIALY